MPATEQECCHATATETPAEFLEVTHPLDPLTPGEITKAAEIARRASPYGEATRFEAIELMEPD
jgi:primary-amine oxidase